MEEREELHFLLEILQKRRCWIFLPRFGGAINSVGTSLCSCSESVTLQGNGDFPRFYTKCLGNLWAKRDASEASQRRLGRLYNQELSRRQQENEDAREPH